MGRLGSVVVVGILMLANVAYRIRGTILHTFDGKPDGEPNGLISDAAGNLYGFTIKGNGTVFRLTPNSSGGWTYDVLYAFQGAPDGAVPTGIVLDNAGNLYGTTAFGGINSCSGGMGCGAAFKLTPTESGQWSESLLYSFGGSTSDGTDPQASLIFDDTGNLYGATYGGGISDCGTVFMLSPQSGGSWTEVVLYRFTGRNGNGDGCDAGSSLVFDAEGNLYGTTNVGGSGNHGTIYELTLSGGTWNEDVIYAFQGGSDGSETYAALTPDGKGNFYGTTIFGGVNTDCSVTPGCGTVYELSPNLSGGWTETVLHRFRDKKGDGLEPYAPITFDSAGNIYSTTSGGGAHYFGTVFKLTLTSSGGWVESEQYSFKREQDGAQPLTGAVIFDSAGNLYGTTLQGGGPTGALSGTVFEAFSVSARATSP